MQTCKWEQKVIFWGKRLHLESDTESCRSVSSNLKVFLQAHAPKTALCIAATDLKGSSHIFLCFREIKVAPKPGKDCREILRIKDVWKKMSKMLSVGEKRVNLSYSEVISRGWAMPLSLPSGQEVASGCHPGAGPAGFPWQGAPQGSAGTWPGSLSSHSFCLCCSKQFTRTHWGTSPLQRSFQWRHSAHSYTASATSNEACRTPLKDI